MGDVDVFTKLSHLLEKSDISKWENSGNYNNNNLIIIISLMLLLI